MSNLTIAHNIVWFMNIRARRHYFLLSVMSTEGGWWQMSWGFGYAG